MQPGPARGLPKGAPLGLQRVDIGAGHQAARRLQRLGPGPGRRLGQVCTSLARWRDIALPAAEEKYGPDYDRFWAYWSGRPQVAVTFSDLFEPARMQALLQQIATYSGTSCRAPYAGPPARGHRRRIYLNKTLTRLVGRHAPRIDTTIHTLKS